MMQDKDQKLLWEAYQLLGESGGLGAEEALDAILKAWSTFTTKKGKASGTYANMETSPGQRLQKSGGFSWEAPERPIPLADKEDRDLRHKNANMPMSQGTGYSDEAKAEVSPAAIAANALALDGLLADFYPILDIILDGTGNNKEVWFQALRMIEQAELSQMEKYMIRRGMNKVWHNANPE